MKETVRGTNIALLITLAFFFEGCVSHKNILYMQNKDVLETTSSDQNLAGDFFQYTFQKGDIVNIEVRSIDPKVTEIFKSIDGPNKQSETSNSPNANYLSGYKVSQQGTIELPLIGHVVAEGLTIDSLKNAVEYELEKYITDPFIIVRMGGIRYTIIGEVMSPGRYNALQEKLTLFEAIANAGELTSLANRKNIVLVRQNSIGQDIYHIDLTDISILSNPNYNIRPGDLIYAEPHKLSEIGPAVLIGRDIALIIVALSAVIWLASNLGN